ncbi:MAG: hypothetical protein JSV17_02705 [Candidatus Aminicenantes bacterium]|nr:MAG: hypothetical protein JSV17_02705 [Candidatus Aminicenantes bacterium]
MDGIDTTDQVSEGAASQYYDFDAFEEIQVQTAATDITSFTAGAQINLVTKRGSNRLSGGARMYYTHEDFQWDNTPADYEGEGAERVERIYDYGVNIGGPIIRDKLWFWGGFGTQDIKRIDLANITAHQKLPNVEFKLNAVLGRHRLEGFFNFANSIKKNRVSHSIVDGPGARYNQSGSKPIFKIQDEISVSDNLFLSIKGSRAAFGFDLNPVGDLGPGSIWYSDDATNVYWNTYRKSLYDRTQYFGQGLGKLFADELFGASREFKFGLEMKHAYGIRVREYAETWLRYRDYEAKRTRYAYIYRNSDQDYRINRFGAFFQDSIDVGRFTVLASLRYDRQWVYFNELTVPGTNVSWSPVQLPTVTIEKGESNVIWNTLSPRLGIIYDIAGDGKTMAKLNLGLYGSRYDSGFISDLCSTYGYIYYNWTDTNGDELVSIDEVERPRVRDSFTQLDPDDVTDKNMVSPKTFEVTFGLERELLADVGIGGTVIYRRNFDDYWTRNYMEDGDTLRLPTPDDWEIAGEIPAEYGGYAYWDWKDGLDYSDETWRSTRPDYYERYLGFELTFKKRFSSNSKWLLNGSFTIQDWRRYYPTRASYNSPTNVEQLDGEYAGYTSGSSGATEQSLNPRRMAKLSFAYQLPLAINVGGTLTARDGYIFRDRWEDLDYELVSADDDHPMVYASPYGTNRLDSLVIMNLRIDKTFRIQDRFGITIAVDMFNVFNANTTISQEDVTTNTNFEQIYQYLNPRIVRFGVRFSF